MDALSCGICLEVLKGPVATPCGHLHCEACLVSHIETSTDALTASCPTCRATFYTALPDLRFVPKKYQKFMLPGIRRIYVTPEPANGRSPRELQAQVAKLNERIDGLLKDKAALIERAEAAQAAAHHVGLRERDARQAHDTLAKEMEALRRKYDGMKAKYRALKTEGENPMRAPTAPTNHKRKSSQALDGSAHSLLASASDASGPSVARDLFGAMVTSPRAVRIPKRPRLLGSPFDLTKRIETRANAYGSIRKPRFAAQVLKEDTEEDDDEVRLSDLSSSSGPQRSGLPAGDLFSPGLRSLRGGHGSIEYSECDDSA